jgi:hypothetical protein
MPVIPNLMERLYMLRLNRGPGPMLDLFNGMGLEAALLAQDLEVFAALEGDPASVDELAGRVDASEEGLAVLLAFLADAGYVARDGERYELTTMTGTWLLASAETSYARYFRFWQEVLYPFWREHARAAIRDGEPPESVYDWLDDRPELWPVAQSAFELTAELIGDDVAERLDLPDYGRLLDVGGGHALYSAACCERYPGLTATVFDDPAVEGVARENLAAAGLEDRVAFRAGDYETDPLGEGYDGALVFNVVHGNDRATNRALFESLAEAVAPGGTLAILDQFGDETGPSIADTGTHFLDLTYLVSLGGRTYDTGTVRDWLADASFRLDGRHEVGDRNMTLLLAERV